MTQNSHSLRNWLHCGDFSILTLFISLNIIPLSQAQLGFVFIVFYFCSILRRFIMKWIKLIRKLVVLDFVFYYVCRIKIIFNSLLGKQ